jgi:hypothetical protein
MGIGDTLSKEVRAWGTLGILVVIMSLILLKFKTSNIGSITCASGYTYNSTANNCYNATATTNIGSVASTLDTFVTALSEPKNWVIIAIIALIGFSILKYFQKKSR